MGFKIFGKRLLIAVCSFFHLACVCIVASHLDEKMVLNPLLAPLSSLVHYYSAITFANRNFGFFAPEVSDDSELMVTVSDKFGNNKPFNICPSNGEMRMKKFSLLGHFGQSDTDMDLFARSWALKAFNDDPDTQEVEVRVSRNHIPSMSDFRHGFRTYSSPFYISHFGVRKNVAQ